VRILGEFLAEEGQRLVKYLQPGENQTTSKLLEQFSLERIMSEAEHIAPTLCQLLHQIATKEPPEKDKVHKDCSLGSSISFILC
jgi:hypothetical protein